MIKFFRKIREDLLSERKTRKYFKYAFGELILVIVGILIALQLNNWNEVKKSKQESNRLLIELTIELENDILQYEVFQQEYEEWSKQITYVLDTVLDGTSKKITSYNQLGAGRLSMNYLSINKVTYQDLFSSGRNLEFDKPEIVREIKNYYQYADNQLKKLNSDNEEFYRLLMSYYGVEGINTLNRIIQNRNVEYINWSWLSDPGSKEFINLETAMLLYGLVVAENQSVIEDLKNKSLELVALISQGDG